MKILMLNGPDQMMGAPRSLYGICQQWKRNGHEIVVLTQNKGPLNDKLTNLGIENYAIPYTNVIAKNNYKIVRYLREIIMNKYAMILYGTKAKRDYDFIYSSSSIFRFGAMISRKYNQKHIWHIREFGDDDYGFVPVCKHLIEYMNANCEAFISNSDAVRNHWIKKGIDKDRIKTIYNGIDESSIIHKSQYTENGKIRIVFSGSISRSKGQYQLIDAIKKMDENIRDDFVVDFWGKGTDESYCDELIKDCKDHSLSNIHFKGYNDNIVGILEQYDIGVVASRAEAFGRVTVEYMMAGLCVIATNTGANCEIIDDGINGLVYEYNDTTMLMEKLKLLYYKRKMIKEYGLEGRKKAIKEYTEKRNADEIMSYISRII